LDAALDVSTFTLINSSHAVHTTFRLGYEVTFDFENIFLPDSIVNEPASHGYVLYRIKGLVSNPDPTPVNNTAYIFFDLNDPVQTNTTLTTFSDQLVGLTENNIHSFISVYPNPMDETAIIELGNNSSEIFNISIADISGRLVISPFSMIGGSKVFERSSLKAGMYFITARPASFGSPLFFKFVVK
jgi:hypothetical protein